MSRPNRAAVVTGTYLIKLGAGRPRAIGGVDEVDESDRDDPRGLNYDEGSPKEGTMKKLLIIAGIALFSATAAAQSLLHGQPGTNYQNIGGNTYGSDGSTYQNIGNTTYGPGGNTSQRIGNTTYHSG